MAKDTPKSNNGSQPDAFYNQDNASKSNAIEIPQISLPKGGGAIKGIEEKFEVNSSNGTGSFSLSFPVSPSRSNFQPSIGLSYNSGGGNSVLGLGWNVSLPSIKRKTEKKIPTYTEEDVFLIAGAEDLVPTLKQTGSSWEKVTRTAIRNGLNFLVTEFRPRIEGLYSRIEQWKCIENTDIFWRTISKDNTTTFFGVDSDSRIVDPNDPSKIFEWLISYSHDDKGNLLRYEYKHEDFVDFPTQHVFEKNKIGNVTNVYVDKIYYGNKTPFYLYDALLPLSDFVFEVAFDYGQYDGTGLGIYTDKSSLDSRIPSNVHVPVKNWDYRSDPFSINRSGFEVRTYRLCKRIMMFHHFAELGTNPYLVRSYEFEYKTTLDFIGDNTSVSGFTYLSRVLQKGHKLNDTGTKYLTQTLPPFDFIYEDHQWNTTIQTVDPDQWMHAPIGIQKNYKWIDLYSEGISGILTESANSWWYKENLGNGNFSHAKNIEPRPNFSFGLAIQDLEGDGKKYLVNYEKEPKGFYPLSTTEEWQPFQTFQKLPNISFQDPNTKFFDIDGDGIPDLVISEEQAFVWYEADGKKGYKNGRRATKTWDEEKGPALVFADKEQSIFLIDMSGDGLTDIVRVRNGSICYWANQGYGKFSSKVTMANAPLFDSPDLFNPSNIRFADIDGSGTTDIIYLGKNEFQVWFNLSGNAWKLEHKIINPFPATNPLTDISIVDFLGTGTSCIVWSSSEPKDDQNPIKYIDLMGSKKPHLLVKYLNNTGKESRLTYCSSTKFYLEDKLNGKPWVTKLPFPVHVVHKTETIDLFAQLRFASEYSYHHGYYDHDEREFRGFGRTEKLDTEVYEDFTRNNAGDIISNDFYIPPVLSKSWFHTGAFVDQDRILTIFKNEYFQNDQFPTYELPDAEIVFPTGINFTDINAQEYREALRTCKGMPLRTEVYSLDGDVTKQHIPYTVSEHNCHIRMLQPKGENHFASFVAIESEAISYQYERVASDPHVSHKFNLEIDEFGHVLKSAAVVYPRFVNNPNHNATLAAELTALDIDIKAEQVKLHVLVSESKYTNDIFLADEYRMRIGYETQTYELTGTTPAQQYFDISELRTAVNSATPLAYHLPASAGIQIRCIEHARSVFLSNDTLTPLPLGTIASRGIPYDAYQLALTNDLVTDIYGAKVTNSHLLTANFKRSDDLKAAGVFPNTDPNNHWWIRSGRALYPTNPQNHFYLPNQYEDPYGTISTVVYDSIYHLYIKSTEDVLGNISEVTQFDFRVLGPIELKDINDNLSQVAFDILGKVVATVALGKGSEGDNLTGFQTDLTQLEIETFFQNPHAVASTLLANTSGRFINNFYSIPLCSGSIVREFHVADELLGKPHKYILAFEYSSGSGVSLMQKIQAEPGEALMIDASDNLITVDTSPALRWTGTGRTILNNKGKAVKQYEPYFSTTHQYEDDRRLVEIGVTPIIHYDSAGRIIRVDQPNGTFTKTEFDAWKHIEFDAGDNVTQCSWYTDRITMSVAFALKLQAEGKDPIREQEAAQKAAAHANTPQVTYMDNLGRAFCSVSHNRIGGVNSFLKTIVERDIEGNIKKVTDARGNEVMRYKHDILGHKLYQKSPESGEVWLLNNIMGLPLYKWDSKNFRFEYTYDTIHRPLASFVFDGGIGMNHCYEKNIYGEGMANDKTLNKRGQLCVHYDTSGKNEIDGFTFKSEVKKKFTRIISDYKNTPNWDIVNPDSLLDIEVFTTEQEFDALGRTIWGKTPDLSITKPVFNKTGQLKQVEITQNGSPQLFVNDIQYNEKGMRKSIHYGNGVKTTYAYDKETYKLITLESRKGTTLLQQLHYAYDPMGNITETQDDAQPDIFFGNSFTQCKNKYTYDALYRLIEAGGREHAAQANFGSDDQWENLPFLKQYSQSDPMAWQAYTQKYSYDNAGNIVQMKHQVPSNTSCSWTRDYDYALTHNQLQSTSIVGGATYSYAHDPDRGFITSLPHLHVMQWNFRDELAVTAPTGSGNHTYYVYDSHGQRTHKITEYAGTTHKKEERIYVEGIEIYRSYTPGQTLDLERQTLHVHDDAQRIAIVETRTQGNDGSPQQLVRYQMSNLLHSASMETDDTGVVISYEEYHPFGTTSYQAVDKDIKAAKKRYRYTGKERDEETGFYYHGARYYMAWLGRWLSPDPIGTGDGLNVYAYCSNNPINLYDPNGHFGWDDVTSAWSSVKQQAGSLQNKVEAKIDALSQDLSKKADSVKQTVVAKVKSTTVYKTYADAKAVVNQKVDEAKKYVQTKMDSSGATKTFNEVKQGVSSAWDDYKKGNPLTAGVMSGVTNFGIDTVKGLANIALHPIDTATGIAKMGFYMAPVLPGLSMGDILTPKASANFKAGLTNQLGSIKDQFVQGGAYEKTQMITYGVTFVASFFIGVGEAKTASTAAEAGEIANVTSKTAEVGDAANMMSKAEGLAGKGPTGEFYSVAFEVKLPSNLYPNKGPGTHFLYSNKALAETIASDAKFAESMEQMGISVPRNSFGTVTKGKIPGFVWHHAAEEGTMHLVPQAQHTNPSIFWNTLHPNGRGGMSIWGGGYK